jgi:phosphonate transport system ATP-binding protein
VYELLERVGIPEKLFERTDRLSGGQQQRVALARALFQKPVALIADEPVSSVDPARARDTIELLTRISREEGLTLCMSLHNFELAREHLPRLFGLRDGKVVFDRASGEIGDEQFDMLYTLEKNEMWRDGA